MESDKAFQIYLAKYHEAHLAEYITFMMQFRAQLQTLTPSDVIALSPVDLGDLLRKVLPHPEPIDDLPTFECLTSSEPSELYSDYLEQQAAQGKGAFLQALWTVLALPKLYRLAYKAWRRHGPQPLAPWILLAQAVLDGCFALKWPESVFQIPETCSICLSPMHWPEKTHCGHVFHMRCLLQHLEVRNTCPLCRAPNPIRAAS